MKRKLVIALLALGTVGGFASGFRSMRCHHQARREAFEDRIADVCVRAAQRSEGRFERGEGRFERGQDAVR